MTINVKIQKLPHAGFALPAYESAAAAGADICAALPQGAIFAPMQRMAIPLAWPCLSRWAMKPNTPSSGLAIKQGLSMVNSPGT